MKHRMPLRRQKERHNLIDQQVAHGVRFDAWLNVPSDVLLSIHRKRGRPVKVEVKTAMRLTDIEPDMIGSHESARRHSQGRRWTGRKFKSDVRRRPSGSEIRERGTAKQHSSSYPVVLRERNHSLRAFASRAVTLFAHGPLRDGSDAAESSQRWL